MRVLLVLGILSQNSCEVVKPRDPFVHRISPENYGVTFTKCEEIRLRFGVWHHLYHLFSMTLQVIQDLVFLHVVQYQITAFCHDRKNWHVLFWVKKVYLQCAIEY